MSLRQRIEQFVQFYLTPYPVHASKSKFVHDPIWGTIEIKGHELCILDTPLLQRLRQIPQTGCVFATYPSATHSRLEHTIGVMHLAGRMSEALKKRYSDKVDDRTEQKVRLAALMHDAGHSAFSHTSEEVYGECSDIAEMVETGGEFEDKGPGEVMSYLIATSDPFRRYFEEVKKSNSDLKIEVDDFAPLILGRSSDQNKQFEADIISGAFDADKLDYFPRDGRAAGLELSVDIDRLLHCLEISEAERFDGKRTSCMVVSRGGYNALQQLLFARATMFSTVYHHHTVRACDCMVKACFELFQNNEKPFKQNKVLTEGLSFNSAGDFLFITDNDFYSEPYNHNTLSEEHKLFHDLHYRRLFKRVLTVSSHTIDGLVASEEAKSYYGEFYNLRSQPDKLRSFAKEVWKAAKVECEPHRIWFDIPLKPSFDKAGKALINVASRDEQPKLEKLAKFIPVKEWVDTYRQYNAQSFLFGPPDKETRVKLARAARELIKTTFGFSLTKYAFPSDIRREIDS
jgi:HD superfamily phosphohydrolase